MAFALAVFCNFRPESEWLRLLRARLLNPVTLRRPAPRERHGAVRVRIAPNISGYSGSSVVYGFRVLPAGRRNNDGSNFNNRGSNTYFWSSSAYSSTNAWIRRFNYSNATVNRNNYNRSYGLSVRCIRDSIQAKRQAQMLFFIGMQIIRIFPDIRKRLYVYR
jgi:uncharacterized protein (TIGR02145 family)